MIRQRFRKHEHLRKPAEFSRVYALRCVARQSQLTVFAVANGRDYSRVGLSVSKKHGSAVVRNRLKRLLREAFRLRRHQLPVGLDLILIPEQGGDATLTGFQAALTKAAAKLSRRLDAERKAAAAVSSQSPEHAPPRAP